MRSRSDPWSSGYGWFYSVPGAIKKLIVLYSEKMWQMWTAFGIMLGYVADVALYNVPDRNPHIRGLNWRLMLGSVRTHPIILCVPPDIADVPR
jgi:hypothetical protein